MKTVSQLLENKGHDIWSVSPRSTVLEAIKLMADKSIGAVIVLSDNQLKGILSERDYTCKVILKGRSSSDTPVADIMQSKVICARPDSSMEECMVLMTEKKIRHLPVIDDQAIVGMISIGDIVKEIISEQQYMIEQLESYIHG